MTADGFYQHATRTCHNCDGKQWVTRGKADVQYPCGSCTTGRVSVPVTEPDGIETPQGSGYTREWLPGMRPVLWALILFGDVIYEIGDDGEYLANTAYTIIGYDPEDDTYTLRRLRDNLTIHEPAEYITNGKDWGLDLDHVSDLRRQHPDLTP